MADSIIVAEEVTTDNSSISFLELILDIIDIFEPALCLTQSIFWRQLPRVIEEKIEIPENIEQEWETIKILFKRMEHYFQTHNEISSQESLQNVLIQLKKVMVSGFKMLFSAALQEMLVTWYENCKDTLTAMEDLLCSSRLTTHTSTSTHYSVRCFLWGTRWTKKCSNTRSR